MQILCELEQTGNMEIIFLDIQMAGINGVETAKAIRKRDTRVVLIFVSSYDQYCKELIEIQPFAFIDKPISESRINQVLDYAVKTRLMVGESFCFSAHRIQYNIPLSEIRFFQSDRRIIRIDTLHTSTLTEEYIFYGKLEKVEETINKTCVKFLRIRKSFLVNTHYIVEYAANKVVLDNGMILEIGKNYKETVKKYYLTMLKEREWV